MPIAYSCPHCNKQFSVAEQYAGQSGPCAACGKPITIPAAGKDYAYAPQAGAAAAGGGLAIAVVVLVVLLTLCAGIGVALVLPAVQAARESARRSQSSNNLKQIGLALHNYHDTYNAFPPAVVTDANGRPLYSGRVLLLPFLEQNNLYKAFNLDEAWDSPTNLPISKTSVRVFMDPSNPNNAPGKTDYLFVTGKGTIFEVNKPCPMGQITDGTSNTIMCIEAKGSGVGWAQPGDFDASQPTPLPPGNHPGGNLVLFADGSVRFIPQPAASPQTVHQLSTRSGGEIVTLP
jgi:hypothetical protein